MTMAFRWTLLQHSKVLSYVLIRKWKSVTVIQQLGKTECQMTLSAAFQGHLHNIPAVTVFLSLASYNHVHISFGFLPFSFPQEADHFSSKSNWTHFNEYKIPIYECFFIPHNKYTVHSKNLAKHSAKKCLIYIWSIPKPN